MNRRMNGDRGLLLAANKAANDQAGKVAIDDQIDEVSRWIAQCSQAKGDMARRGQVDQIARIIEPALNRQRAILHTLSMVRAGVTNIKLAAGVAPADILPGLAAQMLVVIFAALVDRFGNNEDDRPGFLAELVPELFSPERQNVRVEWAVTEGGGFTIRTLPLGPGEPSAPIPEVSA